MSVAVLFICSTLVYVTVNIIITLLRNYRAQQFFKIKAPKLTVVPKASIWHGHLFGLILEDKNWRILNEFHKKYGPTFGWFYVDQPWVSTKDPDLLKLIEVDQAHKHVDRSNLGMPFTDFNHSIFQVNGDQWRRVRRAIAPALTNHKVRASSVTADIQSIIGQLDEGIRHRLRPTNKLNLKRDANNNRDDSQSELSMILDTGDMFQRYTLAVIFLITYKREGTIDFKSERDPWVEKIEESARQINNPFINLARMFPFMRQLIEFLIQLHPVGKMKAQLIDYIVEATDINRLAREQHAKAQRKQSLENGTVPERSFSQLYKAGNFKRRLVDGIIDALMDNKISHDEFLGSTLFLLLAGFMTTADTITCLVWQLARNPDIQKKLCDSIQREGIDSEYLNWCVLETVRFHPAVPLGVGRVLGEDVNINGLYLPKGCFVMPTTHDIHHDPQIWPEPERFWPERWSRSADFHPAAFMGFGLGPRNCVGGKLAMHEIKLVTQRLLANYRIESCAETSDSYQFSAPGLLYTNLDVPIKVKLVALQT